VGKLFYGTQTGVSEGVAMSIQAAMPDLISEVRNIYGVKPEELEACDFLVLGGSTWGDGELTDDWADYLPKLDSINFTGKKVALFALGDQHGYSYNFVSAMKILYDKVIERGGEIIAAEVSRAGFEYDHSEAVVNDYFVGLVVDEVNEPDLTEKRIESWAKQVRLALTAALV
jgi:flavodoxin I